ncbi:cell envelope integrity protein CreD [Apibacter adventoris]|uniref:cell envelope integrity protein CreD n=1 Tax=Apibacter adventoris TaxID=1679466 RepID=UPI000CF70A40|nr:cell envelope integrity protein CreD [Apibacter adventoris]PQL94472.1 hypothetical protein C4S76_05455 [Apibacter adventoris]
MENQNQPEDQKLQTKNELFANKNSETKKTLQKKKQKINENILVKGLIVIVLILIMLIPTPFILNLIKERKERKEIVINEVGAKFGTEQTLYGPFIKVPYKIIDPDKKIKIDYVYLSPNKLSIMGNLDALPKYRGIFDVMLYQAKMNISADFNYKNLIEADNDINYEWEKAKIVFGISDSNGLNENLNFIIKGKTYLAEVDGTIDTGEKISSKDSEEPIQIKWIDEFAVPVNLADTNNIKIEIPLSVKGMNSLNFLPISKNTKISLQTDIKDLKFDGNESPIVKNINNKTKKIEWTVPARKSEEILKSTNNLQKAKFWVQIIQPNDEYGKTNRVAKYSILFIGLTFVTFFFIEIINKLKIHPIQYILVGLALTVFYLLLLSLSEYIGFNKSYIISATATELLICWFIKGIVKNTKIMGGVFIVLTLLYGYIFIIIQLDELALLAGSIGLFIIIGLLMYFSRKIEIKIVE